MDYYYIKRLGNIPAKLQKRFNIPGDTDPGALHMRSGSKCLFSW